MALAIVMSCYSTASTEDHGNNDDIFVVIFKNLKIGQALRTVLDKDRLGFSHVCVSY